MRKHIREYKVNRCLARYSSLATTTNRAPNEPARPGPKWPKMAKFGRFWVKNPNIYWRKRNHLGTLFASFFGWSWEQMGQKCLYLAKKANFGPNLAVFGPKILIIMGVSKSFGTNITKKPYRQFFRIFFCGHGIKWAQKTDIWPKMPVLGQKSIFVYREKTVFTFSLKVFFWPKMHFNPKTPKIFWETDIYSGKGNFYLWTTFSSLSQNMVRIKKWPFFWARNFVFWPKNPQTYMQKAGDSWDISPQFFFGFSAKF